MNTKFISVVSILAKAEDQINNQLTKLSYSGEEATLVLEDNLVTVTVRVPSLREKEIFTIFNTVPRSITTNTMLTALYDIDEATQPPNYLGCILRDYISSVYDISLEIKLPDNLDADSVSDLYQYLINKYLVPITVVNYGPFYH